mmetsp:Transcript_7971/g.29702  ORF Transcript_7971/g.29702 Transcript_7971/m.29702 type:complete len:377 (+) Transcript_7971:3-1133(+)
MTPSPPSRRLSPQLGQSHHKSNSKKRPRDALFASSLPTENMSRDNEAHRRRRSASPIGRNDIVASSAPQWQHPNAPVFRKNGDDDYHQNRISTPSSQYYNDGGGGNGNSGIDPSSRRFNNNHQNHRRNHPPTMNSHRAAGTRRTISHFLPQHAEFERMTYEERLKARFETPVHAEFVWDKSTLFTEMPQESLKAIEEKKKSDAAMKEKMEAAKQQKINGENAKSKKKKKEANVAKEDQDDDDDEASKILKQQFAGNQEIFIGPRKTQMNARHNWSKILLPGEGDAIAQYVSQNKRIPRRGEVGLTSDQIAQFEKLGYVMSGSTHRVIERVRKQKEALVMKGMVEEKERIQRGEKRMTRENEVMGRFRNIVKKMQKK